MNVLVACEFSGTVRDAFRAKGHSAFSCDILPAENRPALHIQGDALEAIKNGRPTDGAKWDLVIAHPPCTYLCSSGLHWNKRTPGRAEKTEEALAFVQALLDSPVPMLALENPIGCISTRIRKYDQKVQPWQFGHDASKGTCLWLNGLPPLKHTKIIPPANWTLSAGLNGHAHEATYKTIDGYEFATLEQPPPKPVWGNQTPSGQNKLGPSPDRWAERSKTYQGIAEAMADQWGAL